MVGKSIFSFSYIFSRSLLFVLLHVGSKKKAGRGAGYSSASSGIFFLWATSPPPLDFPRLHLAPFYPYLYPSTSRPVPTEALLKPRKPPCRLPRAIIHPLLADIKPGIGNTALSSFLGKYVALSPPPPPPPVVSSRELALETREEEEEEGTEMAISAPCRSQSPLSVLPSLWLPSISRGSASSASSIFHFPTEREEEEKG